MSNSTPFDRWRKLVEENDVDKVIHELRATVAQSSKLRDVVLLNARNNDRLEKIILGQLSPAEEHEVLNGIRAALYDLIAALETGEERDPGLAQAWATITVEGDVKNAVFGSRVDTGGGDFMVGDQYITQAAPEAVAKFLTPAPFRPEVFLGRDATLAELHVKLADDSGNHLFQLHGAGGIGKSTLAAAYYERYVADYDHLGWLFAGESIAAALLRLAPGLNVEFPAREVETDRLERLLTAAANLSGKCLLVLDNVDDQNDLETHFHLLAKIPNVQVLMTSRLAPFPGTEAIAVDTLGETTGRELFARHYQLLAEEEAKIFSDVYHAVGGNTLVLELLGKTLRRANALKKDKYLLPDLLADIQQKGVLQLTEQKAVTTGYGGRLQKAAAPDIIAAMFDLDALHKDQVHLLLVFAVLRSVSIPFADLELLVTEVEELEDRLLELVAAGWLVLDEENAAFRCSPVVQEVVREKLPDWPETLAYLPMALNVELRIDGGGHMIKGTLREAFRLVLYGESLAALWLRSDEPLLELWQNLGGYYAAIGDLGTARDRYGKMLKVAQDLHEANPDSPRYHTGLGIAYQCLARITKLLGQPENALEEYRQATAWIRRGYEANREDQLAQTRIGLLLLQSGHLLAETRRYDRAAENYVAARQLFEKLTTEGSTSFDDWKGLGIAYQRQAELHAQVGDPEVNLSLLRASTDIFDKLAGFYPGNLVAAQHLSGARQALADGLKRAGEYQEAAETYQKNLFLNDELSRQYPDNVTVRMNLATASGRLAEMYLLAKEPEEAVKYSGHAVNLLQQLIGARPGNAEIAYRLALAWRDMGRCYEAVPAYDKAVYAYGETMDWLEKLMTGIPGNPLYREVMAGLYYHLSSMTDEPARKREFLTEGVTLYRELIGNFKATKWQTEVYERGRDWGEKALGALG